MIQVIAVGCGVVEGWPHGNRDTWVDRPPAARWEFRVTTETGQANTWDWAAFRALPSEQITVDLHCVTKWSKLATGWRGVSLDTLLGQVQTSAGFALARSYGGYTNRPSG